MDKRKKNNALEINNIMESGFSLLKNINNVDVRYCHWGRLCT